MQPWFWPWEAWNLLEVESINFLDIFVWKNQSCNNFAFDKVTCTVITETAMFLKFLNVFRIFRYQGPFQAIRKKKRFHKQLWKQNIVGWIKNSNAYNIFQYYFKKSMGKKTRARDIRIIITN